MEYQALQKLAKELLDLRAGLWNPNGFPAVGQKHSDVLTEFCANQLDFLCVVETRDRSAQSSKDGFTGTGGATFGFESTAAEIVKTQFVGGVGILWNIDVIELLEFTRVNNRLALAKMRRSWNYSIGAEEKCVEKNIAVIIAYAPTINSAAEKRCKIRTRVEFG